MRNFWTVIVIMICGILLFQWASIPEASIPRKSLDVFPEHVGPWSAIHSQQIGKGSMEVLQVDDYAFRTYRNPSGYQVGLYIGYYRKQKEGKLIHSPRQCLPGSGYQIVSHEVLPLSNEKYGQVPVNKNLMRKGKENELYIWWYQGRGRIYADEYLNRIYLVIDAILHHRSDGALVRVNTSVNEDPAESQVVLQEFIEHLFPLLTDYIPE